MWYSVALFLYCYLGEKCYNCFVVTVLQAYYKLCTRCTSTIRRCGICKGTNCFFELLISIVFSGDKNKTEALLQDFSLLCYFAN